MTGARQQAPDADAGAPNREVRALKRGLAALGLLNQAHAMSIAQLALALHLPRTTTERLLHTLVVAGYIERTADDKQYRQTARVLTLSSGFTAATPAEPAP